MSGRRNSKGQSNVFYSVIAGALISAAIMLMLSAVGALIANMTKDPLAVIPIASLSATLCAAAISGYIIAKRSKAGKMLTAALASLLLCLILLLIGLAISGGAISGSVFINYICYIGVSLIFAKLGTVGRKHRR